MTCHSLRKARLPGVFHGVLKRTSSWGAGQPAREHGAAERNRQGTESSGHTRLSSPVAAKPV